MRNCKVWNLLANIFKSFFAISKSLTFAYLKYLFYGILIFAGFI